MSAEPNERAPHWTHWADVAADKTLRAHPGAESITVAAGITPSGVVHIGNFREVITVDLVARALRDRGVDVRFIYSWDDFDVLRKAPDDYPDPVRALLQENLRRSIADVPDPWGEYESYASHHVAAFEHSLEPLGITPEFIRQNLRYRSGSYAHEIRKALAEQDTIRRILNDARERTSARSRLPDDWLPLSGFCDVCGRDDLAFTWDGEWHVHYLCLSCAHEQDVDLREGGNLKLPWRVDWPMRWSVERVCFEPGGKDHSSAGGSYDTAQHIVREIYGWSAPEYVGYDFVTIKGRGGKMSSSRGGVITVADCLEIFEPEHLRWLFASYRPNTEFAISFDLDVIKLYEDYDRAVRLAHEAEDGSKKDKKRQEARRTLELAAVTPTRIEPGSRPPELVPFRHLSTVLQTFDGDIEGTAEFFAREGRFATPGDRARCEGRARCVWNWLEAYAPEDFRYRIRREPVTRTVEGAPLVALQRLVEILETHPGASEDELGQQLKHLAEHSGLDLKDFYPLVYDLLLDRDRGPKLTSLLTTMGFARALPLLRPSASA